LNEFGEFTSKTCPHDSLVLASAGLSDTAVLDKPSEQVRVLRGDAFSVISTSQVETILMKMNDMGMNIL
jgi:hypothetical protein